MTRLNLLLLNVVKRIVEHWFEKTCKSTYQQSWYRQGDHKICKDQELKQSETKSSSQKPKQEIKIQSEHMVN